MYKCEQIDCKEFHGTPVTPPNQSLNKMIVETRPKVYERTIRRGRGREFIDKVNGWEIVKEKSVCAICFERLTGLKPASNVMSLKQIMRDKEQKEFKKRKKSFKYKKRNSNHRWKPKNERSSSKRI